MNKLRKHLGATGDGVTFNENAPKDLGDLFAARGPEETKKWLTDAVYAARCSQEREAFGELARRFKEEDKQHGTIESVTADSVPMKLTRWLWKNRVPFGALTVFFGMPDGGKSTVAIDVVSRL